MQNSRMTLITAAVLTTFSVSGCVAANQQQTPQPTPTAPATAVSAIQPAIIQVAQASTNTSQGFVNWQQRFKQKARAAGISQATLDKAFRGIQENQKVVEYDRRQPEFSRPLSVYLAGAVSDTRIANGKAKYNKHRTVLEQIGQRYNVDPSVAVAIWGLESAYGNNYGSFSIIEALATLAYEGRRQKFAEEQLMSALRIIEAGDIAPESMRGSWAGAMGHTQFIPTSFEAYAVDWTGDGRRDIWDDNPADALASTANYLSKFGWRNGEPWGVEVQLPADINYAQLDDSIKKPVATWSQMGVRQMNGAPLPNVGNAAIIAPSGARGPAFAVFHNFGVIKRYNNATAYALAIGHLSDRLKGGGPFQASWPIEEVMALAAQKELQENLTALGYDTKGVDGIVGPDTRNAVREFQLNYGLIPDGHVSNDVMQQVQNAKSGQPVQVTMTPQHISAMQTALNQRGFNAGTADGVAGSQTRAALQQYQQQNGLAATGIPTVEMYKKLVE